MQGLDEVLLLQVKACKSDTLGHGGQVEMATPVNYAF